MANYLGIGQTLGNYIMPLFEGKSVIMVVVLTFLCILGGFVVAGKIVDRLDGEKLKKITYVVIGVSGILNVVM